MTKAEKASEVLEYLEELDTRTVLKVLESFISDDDLADIYDDLEKDGLI